MTQLWTLAFVFINVPATILNGHIGHLALTHAVLVCLIESGPNLHLILIAIKRLLHVICNVAPSMVAGLIGLLGPSARSAATLAFVEEIVLVHNRLQIVMV